MRFTNKVAVVTGGTAGIGRSTVLRLVAEGATVFAGDIDEEGGASLERDGGGSVTFRRCDVCRVADIRALMDAAAAAAGGIDIVFNNAGAPGSLVPIDEIDEDGWDRAMNLLLRSVAMGIRYAAPHMKGREGAVIVNTASVAGLQAGYGPIAYGTAKAGVIHLTRIAAADLARYGIRVNAVTPGLITTNIFAAAFGVDKAGFEAVKPKLDAFAARAQPVAKAGQPDDVAEAVLFLASDAGRFVNGINLTVDGGMTVGPRQAWDPDMPRGRGVMDD